MILSTPIVCIVLVIINISIILHGHTMKLKRILTENVGGFGLDISRTGQGAVSSTFGNKGVIKCEEFHC